MHGPQPADRRAVSQPVSTTLQWWAEARAVLLVAVFSALLGGAVGVIWHAMAPHLDIHGVLRGSDSANKALIGDDLWLGFLGIIAGVVCVVILSTVAPRLIDGPGGQLGLAVGGCLGMLVADRVGHQIGVPGLTTAIRAAYPGASAHGISYVVGVYDFKVRATAMLLSWPITAVLLGSMVAWWRAINPPTTAIVATYPGSP